MAPLAAILLVSALSLAALWIRLACIVGVGGTQDSTSLVCAKRVGACMVGPVMAAAGAGEQLLTLTLVGRSIAQHLGGDAATIRRHCGVVVVGFVRDHPKEANGMRCSGPSTA